MLVIRACILVILRTPGAGPGWTGRSAYGDPRSSDRRQGTTLGLRSWQRPGRVSPWRADPSPNHHVTVEAVAGVFLVVLPLAFNGFFLLLGRRFDYPDILRRPTEDILNRFQAGGVALKLVWSGFMLTAVLFAPLAVLLGQVLAGDDIAVIPTAIVVGVLAAVVQFLGLARWPFLVPALARTYTDPASTRPPGSDQGGLRLVSTATSGLASESALAISSQEHGVF